MAGHDMPSVCVLSPYPGGKEQPQLMKTRWPMARPLAWIEICNKIKLRNFRVNDKKPSGDKAGHRLLVSERTHPPRGYWVLEYSLSREGFLYDPLLSSGPTSSTSNDWRKGEFRGTTHTKNHRNFGHHWCVVSPVTVNILYQSHSHFMWVTHASGGH